ncbi:MAG: hypothetical protein ACF8LL_01615 [Phycisphaerales bacterium]
MTVIHERVEQARAGSNPYVICRVASGWVVAGDVQPVEAYCLLLPDPVTRSLNDMSAEARGLFMEEMVRLGDALLELEGVWRINYEVLGNLEPALHAHVVPRHIAEPEAMRTKPVWMYDWEAARKFDAQRDAWWVEHVRRRLGEV